MAIRLTLTVGRRDALAALRPGRAPSRARARAAHVRRRAAIGAGRPPRRLALARVRPLAGSANVDLGAAIRGIWVTDSIPRAASAAHRVVTIAPMLASAAARLAGPGDAVDGTAR